MADTQNSIALIVQTKEDAALYEKWLKVRFRSGPEFKSFQRFLEWSKASGYTFGAVLKRHDTKLPCSPDNCYWLVIRSELNIARTKEEQAMVHKWNETVNRIRKVYGMPPIETVSEEEWADGNSSGEKAD